MSTAIYVEHCGCWTVPCDLSRALRYLNRALRSKSSTAVYLNRTLRTESSTARQNKYVQNENADSLTERKSRLELTVKGEKENVSQMIPTNQNATSCGQRNLRTRFLIFIAPLSSSQCITAWLCLDAKSVHLLPNANG